MRAQTLETDYLVVGAGAAGMAFVDALLSDSAADVVMVDRRHAPGGHWNDAYPFVRLHQPSAYYGVNSLALGTDAIDQRGINRGFYERASAPEICAYYDRVMNERLLSSGRVRYFAMCDYVAEHRIVSRVSGAEYEVRVRKKLVDARYLEPSVPATTRMPFEVATDARVVPVNALADLLERADGYTVIGAGKTAADACSWLLDVGVPADDIRWVKPREAWYVNRAFAQGGDLVGTLLEGISLQVEAAAQASSPDDLFARLRAAAQLLSVDASLAPTMYKAATMSVGEVEQLGRIADVVRLGRVQRIERDSIVLERGTVPTTARRLHVHCAARGLNPAPTKPLFAADRITLQPIRSGLIPFNAALAGFVEATYDDVDHKNRLCPPNRLPDVPLDWARGLLVSMNADHAWSKEPAVSSWLERSRLNPSRGLKAKAKEPGVQAASKRFGENVRHALERLREFASA